MKLAIALFTYIRPYYLEPVLESLFQNDLTDCDIYVFQDGWQNEYSGLVYGNKSDIDECLNLVERYRAANPNVNVKISIRPKNVGIAVSQYEATKYIFDELGYDYALFMEDDMVLSKNYIPMIKKMLIQFEDDPRVARVQGNPQNTVDPDKVGSQFVEFQQDPHWWAYGAWKKKWKMAEPQILEGHNKFYVGKDYRHIDDQAVRAYWLSFKWVKFHTGYDSLQWLAYHLAGMDYAVITSVRRGEYVGRAGLNCTPEDYERMGFHNQVGPIDWEFDLTDAAFLPFKEPT